jgi:hypothetical protein
MEGRVSSWQRKTPPATPPNLREMIRQIAMLGGFLGRKCDGEPGVKTLWLGFATTPRLRPRSGTYAFNLCNMTCV